MSYYGISVVITILVTALTAFYLLYRAKELNLGILFSITAGSIVLGFSFNPAVKFMLLSLSESININKKILLVLSLLVVLLIFLIFICILSMVISIVIPKKFSSIDCGIYIDKFFSSVKNVTEGFFKKPAAEYGNPSILMQDNVKNEYNLENKLKKPVDTNQIIDTMGIENCENGISSLEISGGFENIVAETAVTIAAVAEPVVVNDFNVSEQADNFEIGSTGTDEGNVTETDMVKADIAEADMSESHAEETDDGSLKIAEQVETLTTAAVDIVSHEELIDGIKLSDNDGSESDRIEDTIEDIYDITIDSVSQLETEKTDEVEMTAWSLVEKAFESKDRARKDQALEYYLQALSHGPDKEMIFWIVLDVCALYKQLGLTELAQSILEGIVERYGSVIRPDIKEEIIKNLK